MNKNRGFTPLAVVLMLSGSLALTGCDDKQAQQGGQQMPAVGVVTVKTEPLQITTELPGRTSAYRIAEVRPQVSGIILKRNFKEGSDIEAGVSLYQIDPATYQATYDSAKGDLAKAQAAANIAQLTVNRYQKLLGTQYISKQEYDQALADAQQANAAVTAGEVQYAVENLNVNSLLDLRRRTRVGMGTCQGELCACRAAGLLQRFNVTTSAQSIEQLSTFLNERWKGVQPIAWGDALRESEFTRWVYQGLCGLEKEQKDAL